MTREEAIKELKIFSGTTRIRLSANFWEALNTVIKVLEQEPCEDAISRKAALDMATTIQTDDYSGNEIMEVVDIDEIKALPPVTPTRNKGKWEYDADKDKSGGHCSRCGHFLRYGEKTNFCPDCGAEMEGEGW